MDRDNSHRTVTVLGGTGFLGRRIVARLLRKGFYVRAASRHPERVQEIFASEVNPPKAVEADIMDPTSFGAVIGGSRAVINAVSLYVEKGDATFERVHVDAAHDLAAAVRKEGVSQFIQISGIGSDPGSKSPYIRARGRGEAAVLDAFADAIIVRPAVMTGPDDAFLTTVVKLIRTLPLYPMFGNGDTRLQPVYVGDVAEGVGRLIERMKADDRSAVFEFAGPRTYTYEELIREVARLLDTHVRLIPLPYAAWDVLAVIGERLPLIPITRNQVDLMRHDNVANPNRQGLKEFGVNARQVDEVIEMIRAQGRTE